MKKKHWHLVLMIWMVLLVLLLGFVLMRNRFDNFFGHQLTDTEGKGGLFRVSVLGEAGDITQMGLEEYVVRVVLGEVSDGYHPEALKAQAVAARTYTLYCVLTLDKHAEGAVCTEHRCCQAYCEPEQYLGSGGTVEGLAKVRNAVEDTKGQVLYYKNELICATYFACSGGKTEAAEVVWGGDYPYLQSVSSMDVEKICDIERIEMTKEEFQQHLKTVLGGPPEQWLGFEVDTVGGGTALLRIGGRLYTGVELRKLLHLKSTVIDIQVEEENMIVQTLGYGHRVGMSQHGANAMAENGEKYESILQHYYTDVVLKTFTS